MPDTHKKERELIEYHALSIFLIIDAYRFLVVLLDLLEMHTAYKQAICVSVLQMCCKYGNKQR